MKYLAHIDQNPESKIISIYDVVKGLNGENPAWWENRTYFSLWYITPMIAKVNAKTIKRHFAFKKGFGGNEYSGGGESLEHQLSKKIIYDLKSIQIKFGNTEGKLTFSEVIIEQPFENGKYRADLYCKIEESNPFDFPKNSMLAIELCLTNKVKKSKEKFYRDKNIAAIEIKIRDSINYNDSLDEIHAKLTRQFTGMNYPKNLHNPNWKKHYIKKQAIKPNLRTIPTPPVITVNSRSVNGQTKNLSTSNNERQPYKQNRQYEYLKPSVDKPVQHTIVKRDSWWKRLQKYIFPSAT